jgi:uncharacterized protein YeaO (DUF488 family)
MRNEAMRTRIQTKHAYEAPAPADGARFLVDRLWPRGVKKEPLQLTSWARNVSPSTTLRKWFNHEPEKWLEFRKRYFAELANEPEAWRPLLEAAKRRRITLMFGAHDFEHNNAVALASFLKDKLKRRTPPKRSSVTANNGGRA